MIAVTVASVLSTVAITDALWQGFTAGMEPPWRADGGQPWMYAGVNLVHVVTYVVMVMALIRVRPRLDTGSFVRWVRRLLVITFALSTALALLLLPPMLGLALARRRELRVPAILLAGSLIPFLGMIVLSDTTTFAHPAYAEALALFGVALLPFALVGAPAASPVTAMEPPEGVEPSTARLQGECSGR